MSYYLDHKLHQDFRRQIWAKNNLYAFGQIHKYILNQMAMEYGVSNGHRIPKIFITAVTLIIKPTVIIDLN